MYAVDLRGQGRSTWTPGRYTLDNFGAGAHGTGRNNRPAGAHPFGGRRDRDGVVVGCVAVHGEQRAGGRAPDAAQLPDSERPYQGERARRALRLRLEAAVARRLGMPGHPLT